jgi:uncharacterized protein
VDIVLPLGGFVCGALAGVGAQYGRFCTMGAVEDAVLGDDWRRAKAFLLAVVIAIAGCWLLMRLAGLDRTASVYGVERLDLLGAATGAILFGIGMAFAGTCGFGLLVRAGAGDLRAFVAAGVLGVIAFAATGGILATLRVSVTQLVTWDASAAGGPFVDRVLATATGYSMEWLAPAVSLLGAAYVLSDARLRRKPRLLLGATMMGSAVTLGWLTTGILADPFGSHRIESLSFVAPLGRIIVQVMTGALTDVGFAVGSVLGVMAGSCAVALRRNEIRLEAFDDVREMRRHLLGATLMGLGGVLARGCTIGQGISAASTLSLSAPLVIAGIFVGARLGLLSLVEGRSVLWWRNADQPES